MTLRPGLRLPKLRPDESLGAVEKTFPHSNSNRQQRKRATGTEPTEQIGIGAQLRGSVDTKGLVGAWHEKNNSDLRIGQNVPETEHQPVPLALRDQKRARVLNHHEAGAVAFRRSVLVAL